MSKFRKKPVDAEQFFYGKEISGVIDAHKSMYDNSIMTEPDYILDFDGKTKLSTKAICRSTPVKAIQTLEGLREKKDLSQMATG